MDLAHYLSSHEVLHYLRMKIKKYILYSFRDMTWTNHLNKHRAASLKLLENELWFSFTALKKYFI